MCMIIVHDDVKSSRKTVTEWGERERENREGKREWREKERRGRKKRKIDMERKTE